MVTVVGLAGSAGSPERQMLGLVAVVLGAQLAVDGALGPVEVGVEGLERAFERALLGRHAPFQFADGHAVAVALVAVPRLLVSFHDPIVGRAVG